MQLVNHRSRSFRSCVAALCSMLLVLSGCTSMYAYSPEAAADDRIMKVGRVVDVTLKGGGRIQGKVTAVDESSFKVIDESGTIVEEIRFDDIEAIEVERVSALKTAGLSLAILVVVIVAALESADCIAFCFDTQ